MELNLGDKAKDPITGFEGVVIARTQWLHGCARVTLQPQSLTNDGRPTEAHTFDELQLVLVERDAMKKATPEERKKGGPRPEPTRREGPKR